MKASLQKAIAPYQSILSALERLAAQNRQTCWLVGGALRDILAGRTPPDLDVATSGDALGLARSLARDRGATLVPLKEEMASCRIVQGGLILDISGLRDSDLEGDLRARDFSINAMALELGELLAGRAELIDPTGGVADLTQRRLRAAGPGVLGRDPLRVLRAYRFISTLGFEPDEQLTRGLRQNASGLASVAKERIAHEWLLTMAGHWVALAVRAMEQDGVLPVLLPELEAGRGLDQNPYHHLDVRKHNLACLEALAQIRQDPAPWFGHLGPEIEGYLAPEHRRALLMTAALLHDVGKPATRVEGEPGWASFHRHDIAGAGLALQACRRLGLSKADAKFVASLVAAHMRPFHLMGAQRSGSLTTKGVRRLVQAAGEHLPGWFALAMADTLAGRGPERPEDAEQVLLKLYGQVAHLRDREIAQALAQPPLVNGNEVIHHLGIRPGPLVGRLLHTLREAQLDGEIGNKDQALALAAAELAKENAPSG